MKLYRGNIVFTRDGLGFTCLEHGYILVRDGKIEDVFAELPGRYRAVEIVDFGERLIIPGFVDMHLHAPQFENLGMGFDKELLPWLETYTFPEERKFENTEYARDVYSRFANELIKHGTTRAVIFATLHTPATEVLFEILQSRGISAYVGRVNMDRNSGYLNEDTDTSLCETEEWLKRHMSPGERVKPIITPRFTPACSDALMHGLGELAARYSVPVQSHLNENKSEIAWVRELSPDSGCYAATYDEHGLFGQTPTVMAHCVHMSAQEISLMRDRGVFAAHCPASNLNLSSGIAPVRLLMEHGVKVCLGTDIAGGHSMSMCRMIVLAVQSSKIYNTLVDDSKPALTLPEAFYLATKAGGEFFESKAGSFEPGYDFDALVIDDSSLSDVNSHSLSERLERFIYTGSYLNIYKRFAGGAEL